jgi:uncharacterized repeat protein (TIGR03803 family)
MGGSDGNRPAAGLIFDSNGALYGTTEFGGGSTFGPGTVFKLKPPVPPATTWKEKVLYRFLGGSDGANPLASLTIKSSGALFGTTSAGGPFNGGTVFKLKPPVPPATTWTEKVLHSFGGPATSRTFASKGAPPGTGNGGIRAPDVLPACTLGRDFSFLSAWALSHPKPLNGTTNADPLVSTGSQGGHCGHGGVFQLAPPVPPATTWTETALFDFDGKSDGGTPSAGLIADSKGALYGTTQLGGTGNCAGIGNCGTVFKLTPPVPPATTWTETVLHNFQGGNDGANPVAGLVFDSAGALYGTTQSGGGPANGGVVFQLTPPIPPATKWTKRVLYRFTGGSDGAFPEAGLIFDSKGALYGTTTAGGTLGNGVVFKLTPPVPPATKWTETVLYSFNEPPDGNFPVAGLIFDSSGALYGTTMGGGAFGFGTVFKVTP